jgi:hypothetical protein
VNTNSNHHLTPNGWQEGDDAPANVVESWRRRAEVINGKLTIDYSRQWANHERSNEDREDLRNSFPLPESSISARIADVCWEITE